MGIHIIKMPDIGEGIAEVELAAWHVAVGDTVREDQTLADVMTDKAAVEIPAPVAGKVLALTGKPGDMLAVGAEFIRLEVQGAGNATAADTAPPPPAPPAPSTAPVQPAAEAAPTPPAAPPPAAPTPAPHSSSAAPARPAPAFHPRPPGEKPLASPAVRRLAWDMGIDLRFVPASGPHGRILREDLEAYAQRGTAHPAPADTARAPRTGTEDIPIIGLRRKIAEKMQEAKRRIPHFSYVEELDVTELETLRAQLNAQHAATRGKLTLLPFLVRALVLALRDFPQINARYDDQANIVTRYAGLHLGIATQTPGGLTVPVLRHAETHDLWSAAAEIQRLAEAARTGKASRDELTGSTLTLTSLGALGGIASTPVINHPEVAIVGVNRLIEKPVVRQGHIVIRQTMNLSSSFDHRVIDGMDAARFIQRLRTLLETPATLFID